MNDAGEISAMLARRMDSLARELLPDGHRQGRDWRVGSIAGDAGTSLAICLSGARAGLWVDHAGDARGDALDLVAAVLYRGELRPAIEWARRWLGLGSGLVRAPEREAVPVVDDIAEDERAMEGAAALFRGASPEMKGTPADLYLQARRINLAELGRQPRALRFHPTLFNVETGGPLPAMVAAVTDSSGRHVATHRTWLAPTMDLGGGIRWGKAPLKLPRRVKGRLRDGCIRLWRGASRKPLPEAPRGETVVIAEGIETALSIVVACPEMRVLAATSLGQIGKVWLPRAIGAVVVAADNDEGNPAAVRALNRAVEQLRAHGRPVRVARSPVGSDFNDLLMAEVAP